MFIEKDGNRDGNGNERGTDRENKERETESIDRYQIYRLMTNRYRSIKKTGEGCEDDRCHPLTNAMGISLCFPQWINWRSFIYFSTHVFV